MAKNSQGGVEQVQKMSSYKLATQLKTSPYSMSEVLKTEVKTVNISSSVENTPGPCPFRTLVRGLPDQGLIRINSNSEDILLVGRPRFPT